MTPMSLSTCIQVAEGQHQKRPFAITVGGLRLGKLGGFLFVCLLPLHHFRVYLKVIWNAFTFPEERKPGWGGVPKSHCPVAQRFLRAFPWPPCRGQACPPSRPLLLPAMLFWVNTIWGVWSSISLRISSSSCTN